MALKNFIKVDSYTRVSRITIQKDNDSVDFEIKVYETDGGDLMYGPLCFFLNHSAELEKYKTENLVLPSEPVYPVLCSDREALTPMWTTEGSSEEVAYDAAKAAYEQDIETYNAACAAAILAMATTAETENEYTKHFSDQKLYTASNATACAYNFLKGLPGFEAVVDA